MPEATDRTADDYIRSANERIAAGDPEGALPLAQNAVDASADERREDGLRLLLALHFQLEQYDRAADVLERLASRWPKKVYWLQLSSVYLQLGEQEKALHALKEAYARGHLDQPEEVVRVARMFLMSGMPSTAATVLERALEDGTLEPSDRICKLLREAWARAHIYGRERFGCRSDDYDVDLRAETAHRVRE